MLIKAAREPAALPFAGSCIINEAGTRPSLVLIYYCDFAFVEVVLKNYLLTYLFACCFDYTTVLWLQPILFLFTYAAKIEYVSVPSYVSFKNRIRTLRSRYPRALRRLCSSAYGALQICFMIMIRKQTGPAHGRRFLIKMTEIDA